MRSAIIESAAGVSASNGYLRPVISSLMQLSDQNHLVELNLQKNPLPEAFAARPMQIAAPLAESLSELADDPEKIDSKA